MWLYQGQNMLNLYSVMKNAYNGTWGIGAN